MAFRNILDFFSKAGKYFQLLLQCKTRADWRRPVGRPRITVPIWGQSMMTFSPWTLGPHRLEEGRRQGRLASSRQYGKQRSTLEFANKEEKENT